MIQWIGAICVVGACGACGFSMAASYTGQQRCLQQLHNGLELMQCQMEYQMTELPELCGILASACMGPVGKFFANLGQELRQGEVSEVPACVALVLARDRELPEVCRGILSQLGKTLGQLDLSGQLRGLAAAQGTCRKELERVEASKAGRLRCYRALGICAGAALAILLL